MADELPAPPAETPPPPATPTPLDQAPLSEFVNRRNKGETATTAPAPPTEVPPSVPPEDEGDEGPLETPGDKSAALPRAKNFKQRFDQVYRQRSEAMRMAEEARAHNLQLQQELTALKAKLPPDPAQQPAEPKPPNLDEFLSQGKTYEDWLDARDDYKFQTRTRTEMQRMLAEREQQATYQAQTAGFQERTEAAKAKYADYDAVVVQNDRVLLSPVMQDIARRSPHGPDIMYWLGTHEAEAKQIGEMTARCTVRDFPLVEAHLLLLSGHSAGNGTPGAKKAVPVSQAPAPITPVGGGSTSQPLPLDQLPLGEYMRRREQSKKVG